MVFGSHCVIVHFAECWDMNNMVHHLQSFDWMMLKESKDKIFEQQESNRPRCSMHLNMMEARVHQYCNNLDV
jgi:hypothetical protein